MLAGKHWRSAVATIAKVFDFKRDLSGARVVVRREPLTNACLNDADIDEQIGMLKDDLDVVARRMKKAIREPRKIFRKDD